MKTYRIEVQRLKAASHAHGMLHLRLDAAVRAEPPGDDGDPASVLSLSEASARTLQQLLKAQFAEIDARKARSQR
jgi:hypothetical protein